MVEGGSTVERGHQKLLSGGGRYAQSYQTQSEQQITDATGINAGGGGGVTAVA